MNLIYDYSLKDLENSLVKLGSKAFHAKQIFKWLYEKRIDSFDKMSDISISLQNILKENYDFYDFKVINKQKSKDGTVKFLFELSDGLYIESVLMKFDYGYSACISSEVGCNMGCKFCASGLLKKQRNLTSGEIVLQVLTLQKYLDNENNRLDNIVVMGTGEPFDNYDNVLKALDIINCPFGLQIGARHISISTCGLVPGIMRFSNENVQYNLAISLHFANNELRDKYMPINRAYNLDKLKESLLYYSQNNNRRITFEYLLISSLNNSEKDAEDIANFVRGLNAYINLIPYNEVKEFSFKSTSDEETLEFYDSLKKKGVAVTLRQKRGSDIDAACGQLRAKEMMKND